MLNMNNFCKRSLILAASTFFILLAFVLLFFRPAGGQYEDSIYQSFPLLFWVSLAGVFIIGTIFCLYPIFSKAGDDHMVISGLSMLYGGYFILLTLIAIRGYYIWSLGDVATNYFYINDIYCSGNVRENMLIYPLLHLQSVVIMNLSGVNIFTIQRFMSIYLYLLFPLFMYVLSRKLFELRNVCVLTLISSFSFLMYYAYFNEYTPQLLADVFLIILLFCVYMSISLRSLPFTLISVIGIICSTLLHPLCSIVTALFITSMLFGSYSLKRDQNAVGSKISIFRSFFFGSLLLLIVGILFVWWISLFDIFDYNITNAVDLLLSSSGYSQSSKVENLYNLGSFYGYNMPFEIIKRYFGNLLFICCGLFVSLYLFLQKVFNKKSVPLNLTVISAFFGLLLLLTGLFFFVDIGVNIWRIITYPTIIGMFVFALIPNLLDEYLKQSAIPFVKKAFSIVLCLVLILTLVNGIFITYPSTYLHMNNYQVTIYDMAGMDFLFSKENDDYARVTMAMSPGRFGRYLLTYDQYEQKKLHDFVYHQTPYHFGYESHSAVGEIYNSYTYLDIHQKDKHIYANVHSMVGEFTYLIRDFERLNVDYSLYNIYDNSEFELYLITPV